MDNMDEDLSGRYVDEDATENLRDQLAQVRHLESIGRLAGGVAHEFNNMLHAILNHTELAMDALSPEDAPYADLVEIRNAARHSSDLTRQLLAFARKQIVSPVKLDLNDAVSGVLQMLRRLIGENIELAWESGPGLWPIKMDSSQVNQILTNLVVNARDAIAGHGVISLWTSNQTLDDECCRHRLGAIPGDYVVLGVNDDGCGMSAETQLNLFEPFFSTKTEPRSTGLGLATVYGIVKQNYGFVHVCSETGRGTTIEVYLPRYDEAPAEVPSASPRASASGCATILLAEDEAMILAVTKRTLERLGYDVLAADTPQEAIRWAREYPGDIDLLLTDVVMPVMNGRQLAEQVLRIRPGIKCLYMSGYAADVITRQVIVDEELQFMEKPFSKKELAMRLRDIIDS